MRFFERPFEFMKLERKYQSISKFNLHDKIQVIDKGKCFSTRISKQWKMKKYLVCSEGSSIPSMFLFRFIHIRGTRRCWFFMTSTQYTITPTKIRRCVRDWSPDLDHPKIPTLIRWVIYKHTQIKWCKNRFSLVWTHRIFANYD